jgi:hypothetical protein
MDIDFSWYIENLNSWFFNLDVCVKNALDFLIDNPVKPIDLGRHKRFIGLGSGNAYETARVVLSQKDSVFANESNYNEVLAITHLTSDDCALLISASGKKDAPAIAKKLKETGLETRLLTCNPNADPDNYNPVDALEFVKKENVHFFKKIPEPYTYNTVTYLGMILAVTGEDPRSIKTHIEETLEPAVRDTLRSSHQFYFLVPREFDVARRMFEVKFQELFGRNVGRDFFTPEFAKMHATDVVGCDDEISISFGYKNDSFCKERLRLNVPLQSGAGYGSVIASGYYVIGKIQEKLFPYFKYSIVSWCEKRNIEPLVK